MLIVGFFVSGATNLVSSAVTADLGCQMAVLGNTEALSTVSGIIEGSGSMGAAIGQALLPVIADAFGWNSIFYGFMIMVRSGSGIEGLLLEKTDMLAHGFHLSAIRCDGDALKVVLS